MTPTVPLARAIGTSGKFARRRLVFVDPDGPDPVRVRWWQDRAYRWDCRMCGRQRDVECVHVFAAALLLAEEMFGLTRMPDLEATTDPDSFTEETNNV